MPILHALIACGSQIWSKYDGSKGQFDELSKMMIGRIDINTAMLTYSIGDYLLHYICEKRTIYMCITDQNFPPTAAFVFLDDIRKKLKKTYGVSKMTIADVYAMNTDFPTVLAERMLFYSKNPHAALIGKTKQEFDLLQEIAEISADNIVEIPNDMHAAASRKAYSVRNTTPSRWKRICLKVWFAVLVIAIYYMVMSMICGGLTWPKCVKRLKIFFN